MSGKYFDLSAIAKELPDYAQEWDPPGFGQNSVFARAILEELDADHAGRTDAQHVVDTFNDALAGLLHGLSVRVVPGQLKTVVDHLTQHASYTMGWIAEDMNDYSDAAKEEDEDYIRAATFCFEADPASQERCEAHGGQPVIPIKAARTDKL
jgi:hypothetical protein